MFLSPLQPDVPGKRAWENFPLHDRGKYYAVFGTGRPTETNPGGRPIALDIAESEDGVSWRFLGRDLIPIPGAHAGFGIKRIGERIFYYPTCSNREKGVHFKIYASTDWQHWEHLGDDADVVPDRRFYADRWDEMHVLTEREEGREVYYGYISSEVREDVGPPACGLLRSSDGVSWEVLPPPVIEWGDLPAQHMELNFCEKIGGRYYLGLSGRFYLGSLGYSLFIFTGDSPRGPFRPDRERFRLTGTSRHNVTWLGHTIESPDGMLLALWQSCRQPHDLPSDTFAIGPLKRLVAENDHLRLKYWKTNDKARGPAIGIDPAGMRLTHPAEAVRTERDNWKTEGGGVTLSASRDGCLVMLGERLDAAKGFMLTGDLTVEENRGRIASHQHAAAAGFYLAGGASTGRALLLETLGLTRIGTLEFADRRISEFDPYAGAGKELTRGRSGPLQGTTRFTEEDAFGPIGQAGPSGVRHGRRHAFRLIARGHYFELYLDEDYVQTFFLPEAFRGQVGLVAFDGRARYANLRAWELDLP
ncbi:MAG: hypothetical protein EA425_17355 [Puniceicoccaceae bacterium]|nr:MAG: hypothetical protein EA425_17355 [Puniceicoccaceae bacterium]